MLTIYKKRNNHIWMMQKLAAMLFLTVVFASCEEYYKPDLDSATSMLVVESQFTNVATKNFVRLTKTTDFYSLDADTKVSGAIVQLLENGAPLAFGVEASPGYFTFTKTATPGKKYTLLIAYRNNTYSSSAMVMPAIPKIDTLYTSQATKKNYVTDSFGTPKETNEPICNVIVDAPISSQLKYFRYGVKSVLQWRYITRSLIPQIWYGWKTVYTDESFNVSGQPSYSSSAQAIKNHTIKSHYLDYSDYLDSAALVPSGWIEIIDQYGITKETYDFYSALNKQFVADGNLFDPVLAQIPSNIYCKTDASIKVVGFFNVCSYRGYRYFIFPHENYTQQKRISNTFEIPPDGYNSGVMPNFWITF